MSGWPGGLRTQALMGFLLLIGLTFGTLALVNARLLQAHGRELALARANVAIGAFKVGAELPPGVESVREENVEQGRVDWERGRVTVRLTGNPGFQVQMADGAETRRAQQLFLLFLSVIAIVLLAFVYAMFTFLVVRPVRAIGVAAERASVGDLASPITLLPGNEFGRVGASFNVMLTRLDEGRVELERRLKALEAANTKLAAAQSTLIRSEKLASVGQLSAGIAHEIGNPLAAISGYNDLLMDGGLDDEDVKDLLARNRAQLQRIRLIIRKLLDFSRDDLSPVEPTSARHCVSEALDLVRALPRARKVTFDVGETDFMVMAAPAELVQVLVNLFINAVDALESVESPWVKITLTSRPDGVDLAVEDNGTGVPPEIRERIFEPFFTTKDPGDGTGLGLAICARILERFGGGIALEPTAIGTRFVVRLKPWTAA